MPLSPIPEILDELRAGRIIVLVDDEDRENEGDFICAAEKITPEIISFMTCGDTMASTSYTSFCTDPAKNMGPNVQKSPGYTDTGLSALEARLAS